MERYRKPPVVKSYKVSQEPGSPAPWVVTFSVDGDDVGGGRYQTPEAADDAGVDFMFSGWGQQ